MVLTGNTTVKLHLWAATGILTRKSICGVTSRGVQLLDNGRVASIVISGFGANGIVPDAIGQLTELRILNLGAHDELVGGHLFKDVRYN